jgi:cytosine/adenosine deaminase-related metal-dependent hydrolase
MSILRPYGIVLQGELQLGLELLVAEGKIQEIRPHTGIPEDYILCAPFVNAHSHLEYRDLLGKLTESDYWAWIGAITKAKPAQVNLAETCLLAAQENKQTGVLTIAEHSDRPFSTPAIPEHGLNGVIFQELITISSPNPELRLQEVSQIAAEQTQPNLPSFLNPHAPQTVHPSVLKTFAGKPISIHTAESVYENQWIRYQSGPITEMRKKFEIQDEMHRSIVDYLNHLGLLSEQTQLVHACDVDDEDIELMAKTGVKIAHCPRSNQALNCPIAPVRRFSEAGIPVGIGLDSAASSGPIDMFAEMRAALAVSLQKGEPVSAEAILNAATSASALPIPVQHPKLEVGSSGPFLKIHLTGAQTSEDIIQNATPIQVEWLALNS